MCIIHFFISEELKSEKKQNNSRFLERLITKIIINTQVTIRNLHVRIETEERLKPVAVGVFFPELSLQSTDSNWTPMHNTSPPMAYKVFSFTFLCASIFSLFPICLICYLAHATERLFSILLNHTSHPPIHILCEHKPPDCARVQIQNARVYSDCTQRSETFHFF